MPRNEADHDPRPEPEYEAQADAPGCSQVVQVLTREGRAEWDLGTSCASARALARVLGAPELPRDAIATLVITFSCSPTLHLVIPITKKPDCHGRLSHDIGLKMAETGSCA